MRRRNFIGLIGGAAAAWGCVDVFAAQKSLIARTGYLTVVGDPECKSPRWETCQSPCPPCWLVSDLRAFGWRDGENLQIVKARVTLRASRVWRLNLRHCGPMF